MYKYLYLAYYDFVFAVFVFKTILSFVLTLEVMFRNITQLK